MSKSSLALVCAVLLGWSALAGAADLSRPVILVAKPELRAEGLLQRGVRVIHLRPAGGSN